MVRPTVPSARLARPTLRLPFTVDPQAAPRIEAGSLGRIKRLPLSVAITPASEPARIVLSTDPLSLPHGTLSREQIRDAAQEALIEDADTQDSSPERFAEGAEIVAPDRLPSRNGSDAHTTLRKTLLARDEAGDFVTLDLHVARAAQSAWDAAIFDRADATRGSGGLPYAGSPLATATLRFDPGAGRFVLPDTLGVLQVLAHDPVRQREICPALRTMLLCLLAAFGAGALLLGRFFA